MISDSENKYIEFKSSSDFHSAMHTGANFLDPRGVSVDSMNH